MKLIVGLGNVGKQYDLTRHNVGFMCLDSYVESQHLDFNENKKFKCYMAKSENNDVLFVKPTTFMNLSGDCVGEIVRYFKINLNDILIIQDDLDLKFGKIKIKFNSSSGGQNGIKHIISCLNSQSFLRLKIGIKTIETKDAKSFVLQKFNHNELNELQKLFQLTNEIIEDFINDKDSQQLMNKFN